MLYSSLHMSPNTANKHTAGTVDEMFKVGAHYGFIKSRRHPTVKPFIFGTKNTVEIFNLELTETQLAKAEAFAQQIVGAGKQILFASSKSEVKNVIQNAAESCNMPFVAGRWIGGTFTNFEAIRRRADKLTDLISQKERGELNKYTKKERLLIDRDITKLQTLFGGIVSMKSLPGALFVVDAKKEHIAVAEAKDAGVPVIALCGSDNDISVVKYPIIANDSSVDSMAYFVSRISKSIKNAPKLNADSGAPVAVVK